MASNGNYGTVGRDSRSQNQNGLADAVDEERAALLGKPANGKSISTQLQTYMTANVSKSWGDITLLACYIITGLLDSASVQVWGSFVSMQTGNTIYFGLGLAAPHNGNRWIRAGISVGCFCLGSFFFSRYHRFFGQRKRWVMVSSFTLQLVMIIGAALMVSLGPKTGTTSPINIWIVVPIALIAFQSAGQAVSSRVLQYGGLTSVVLTSIYCDLFSDQKLFTLPVSENVERNRRATAPIMVIIGAFFGGLIAHSEWGLAGAVWAAAICKGFAVLAWCLWKAEREES